MLIFHLKKVWFDKIKSGEKTHEYREIKPYWQTRIKKLIGSDPAKMKEKYYNRIAFCSLKPCYCMFQCGYSGQKLKAKVISVGIEADKKTDLEINKPVYDIEFKLI